MSDAELALETRALTRRFEDCIALDHVDLKVPRGSIFGFLGPNGAGKTTTLRILAGLARPTSGEVRVLGADARTAGNAIRTRIGFLPDVPGFYPWMTAREFLTFAGELFGLRGATLRERVDGLLDIAGLAGVTRRVGGFSRGMKQRLGVAQALVNAPDLLLFDEPTSALDPIGRRDVLEMIASLRGRATVFLSTHILTDVERVCDSVAILDRGRVVAQESVESLRRRTGAQRLTLQVDGDVGRLCAELEAAPWLRSLAREGDVLRLRVHDLSAAQHALPELLVRAGCGLLRFETGEARLEDVFVDLLSGDAP